VETLSFGTTNERLVRAALFMLLVDVFAIMFLWDGYVGYRTENAAQLVELLGLTETKSLAVNARVTLAGASEFASETPGELTTAAIVDAFGPPTLEHRGSTYYVGPGGWMRMTPQGSRGARAEWTDAKHSESDQAWQRYLGYALALVSFYATYGFMKTAATRITLTNDGLRVFGRKPVAWEAVIGIERDASGAFAVSVTGSQPILIDEYSYKGLNQILATICERKGFANPVGDQ
jgi:hypothetical protein